MANVVTARAWISNGRISGGHRLWRCGWDGPLARRAKVVSASGHANGNVQSLAVPGFMALFFLAIMASQEFRVAGPTTRIAMAGTRNELVTCCSFRLAAHQRTGGLRTTFAEVDVVVRHYPEVWRHFLPSWAGAARWLRRAKKSAPPRARLVSFCPRRRRSGRWSLRRSC